MYALSCFIFHLIRQSASAWLVSNSIVMIEKCLHDPPMAPLSLLLNHPLQLFLQLFVIINLSHIFSFHIAMRMLPFHGIGQSTAASCLYQTELLWWTKCLYNSPRLTLSMFVNLQRHVQVSDVILEMSSAPCAVVDISNKLGTGNLASSCIKLHCHDIEMFPTIPWCSSFHVSHFAASYSNLGAILKMSMAKF